MQPSSQIDAYIAKSQPFAQPILIHIRTQVHKACKEVKETIKWGFPHFEYNGKILCHAASFKQHCALGFWLGSQMETIKDYMKKNQLSGNAMGSFGRITTVKELPPNTDFSKMIKEAMALIDKGVVIKRATPVKSVELPIPPALKKALDKNMKAAFVFDKFPPSHRKEYIQWIAEAKTETTRDKRITTAIEWIAEGKGRNWKYERK
ncbi:MAG: YdeI/OmpD-associated family protein [Niabella sp.]